MHSFRTIAGNGIFGVWRVRASSKTCPASSEVSIGAFDLKVTWTTPTKIQCKLLVLRSGGVGAGSALSLGKIGISR